MRLFLHPKSIFLNQLLHSYAGFQPKRKTRVASHGWQSDVTTFDPLAKAYLTNPKLSETNILLLDWSVMSADWTYYFAASYVPHLGDELGELLGQVLVQDAGVSPDNVHVMGHSLGAHVAGHIGRKMEAIGGQGKVARVTGTKSSLLLLLLGIFFLIIE